MSFVFEKFGDDREFWSELCFRDWWLREMFFSKNRHWCADREREIYFLPIGSFRDETPNFYDLSYKRRIIRMEVEEGVENEGDDERPRYNLFFKVEKISIPNSVWNEASEILGEIEESFYTFGSSLINVAKVSVSINCEPECIEKDYNGR